MANDWLRSILVADSFSELRQSIESTIARFGLRYFMFHARFPHNPAGSNDIYFDNCPAAWTLYYREHRSGGLLRLLGQPPVTPLLWRHLCKRAPELFAKARECGLRTGVTHPVHGPGGQWSAMSFIKDHDDIKAEGEILTGLPRCQLLAAYVHEATARILAQRPGTPLRADEVELNERECQVLSWSAAGKTASETADILAISERTVLFYLANARRKLDASNSRHAISKALSLGLIDLSCRMTNYTPLHGKKGGAGGALGLLLAFFMLATSLNPDL